MKARSYRSVVQPRHVVPRKVNSKVNNIVIPRKQEYEKDIAVVEDIPIEGESNYKYAFNDEKWPEMWYLVSENIKKLVHVTNIIIKMLYFIFIHYRLLLISFFYLIFN